MSVEKFLIDRSEGVCNIVEVYPNNFDAERLSLHRNTLLDCVPEGKSMQNLNDIVEFLKSRTALSEILIEIKVLF